MKKIFLVLVLVLMSFSVPAEQAGAVAVLGFNDGSGDFYVWDGSASDSNPLSGVITFNGAIGSWIVNVTTGITKPVLGGPLFPVMDLNSIDVTSKGPSWLALGIADSGFSYAGPLQTNVGGTTSGSVQFWTAVGANEFSTGELYSLMGPFSPIAFSSSQTNNVDLSPSDWLSMGAFITHSGAGATSFNQVIQPVPEPGTMVLLGSGLVGLAGWGRKKFRK